MKMIIDIPESLYSNIKTDDCSMMDMRIILGVIKNGTPLPKGHGDLKDMGNLKYVFVTTKENPTYSGKDIERAIKSMKTIIEADKEVEE